MIYRIAMWRPKARAKEGSSWFSVYRNRAPHERQWGFSGRLPGGGYWVLMWVSDGR